MAVTPHRLAAALFLSTTALTTVPAYAGPGAEELARGWLDSLAPAGGAVEVGSTTYDPATSTVTFGDVSITAGNGGLVGSDFGTIAVTDPRETMDGAFSADHIQATAVRFDISIPDPTAPAPGPKGPPQPVTTVGTLTVAFDEISVERPVIPANISTAPRGADVSAWMAYATALVDTTASGEVAITNATFTTSGMPEGDSTTRYGSMRSSGLNGGRVEWVQYNDYEQRAPIASFDGTPPSEMVVRIASYATTGFDFGAIMEVVDPSRYANGMGDLIWRSVGLESNLEGLQVEVDGTTVTIGALEVTGFRMRQTQEPFVTLIEEATRNPTAIEADPFTFARRASESILGLAALEAFAVRDIAVDIDGAGALTIGEIALNDLDNEGIGAIRVADVAFDGGTNGSGSLDRFAIQDIVYGSTMPLIEHFSTQMMAEPPFDLVLEAIPQVGWVSLAGLSVSPPGAQEPITVASMDFAASNFIGGLATRSITALSGVVVPTSLIDDAEARSQIEALGFTELDVDLSMTSDWDTDTGRFDVEDVTFSVTDAGTFSFSSEFGGIPLSIFADPMMIESRMLEGNFVAGAVTFGNAGIVERALAYYAEQQGVNEQTFRDQIAGFVTLGLSGQPQLAPIFGTAVNAFLADPQSFTIAAAPQSPISFLQMQNLGNGDPMAAAQMFNLTAAANE